MSSQRPHTQRFLLLLLVSLFLVLPTTGHAATADDFKTSEFWNSTGLNLIGAADAYALGYTGKGITLGIIDTPVRMTHPELSGKVLGRLLPEGYPLGDWDEDDHGSHVAGIMVAKRNGIGMQGVAFDADLLSAVIDLRSGVTQLDSPDFVQYFSSNPEVKVINNSWGSAYFPYEQKDDVASYRSEFLKAGSDTLQLYTLVTQYDKLMVFAAGNEGHSSPQAEIIAPRYIPTLTGWLNVVSVNSTAFSIDADGNKTGDLNSLSLFSNLASGAQLFTVAAPGTNIYSLDATGDGTGYTLMSGTSMAAPYVTGCLGLVQQAFPWMTAKQLADAILTTADSEDNGRFVAPDFTVTVEKTTTEDDVTERILLHYLKKAIPTDTTVDLTAYYNSNKANLLKFYGIDSLEKFLDAYAGNYTITSPSGTTYLYLPGKASIASFADLFGQGLVNVGLAVGGPAILDANRLSQSDYSAAYGAALYRVDTKGYTGTWTNDISQRLWDNALHHPEFQYVAGDDPTAPDKADAVALTGQNVGLLKTGAGTLILTGHNTYQGTTVVRGGTLSIQTEDDDATSGQLANSDVTVESAGVLTGDGTVAGSVTNAGTVLPGTDFGTTFTVGTYSQQADTARLGLGLNAEGQHTSLATTQATFSGGQVVLSAVRDYYPAQTLRFDWSDLVTGTTVTGAGFDWSTALTTGIYDATTGTVTGWSSPTLAATATVTQTKAGTPETASVTFSRSSTAYSQYGANANAREVGRVLDRSADSVQGDAQNMVEALDFSAADGNDVQTALTMLSPRQFAAAERASLSGQRTVTQVLLGRLLDAPASGHTGLASGDAAPAGWRGFLSPLGGMGHVDAGNGLAASNLSWGGILAGLETDPETVCGVWNLGVHAAFLQYGQHAEGPGSNSAQTNSFQLGAQFRFAPSALQTDAAEAYTFGLARVGVESTTQHRGVHFNNYVRTAKSDWVSPVGSLLAGAGYDWTPDVLGGALRLGPVGWLDYATVWRPDVSEYGGQSLNLKTHSAWANSLRTSLGARLRVAIPFKTRPDAVTMDLRALWNHELMDAYSTFTARFASFGNDFTYRDTIAARDSVTLAAGLTGTLPNDLSLGLAAGTECNATSRVAWGSVNLGWSF